MYRLKGWLKICTSHLVYSQIWLNIHWDERQKHFHLTINCRHLGYIEKTILGKKKKTLLWLVRRASWRWFSGRSGANSIIVLVVWDLFMWVVCVISLQKRSSFSLSFFQKKICRYALCLQSSSSDSSLLSQFFFFFSCCSGRVWCVRWRQTVVDAYIHTYIGLVGVGFIIVVYF